MHSIETADKLQEGLGTLPVVYDRLFPRHLDKQIRLGVGEKLPGMNKYSPIPDKVGDSHKPMERGSVMLKSGHSCDADQGPAGILALAPAQ